MNQEKDSHADNTLRCKDCDVFVHSNQALEDWIMNGEDYRVCPFAFNYIDLVEVDDDACGQFKSIT